MGEIKKKVFFLIRILFVAAGLAWGWKQGWFSREMLGVLGQINVWIFILAFLFYMAGQVVVAFRWWILLRTQAIFISIWSAVKLHLLGLFYNNFLPSSVGGDLARAWYVTKHTDKHFEAVLSVVVDRIIGLAGSIAVIVIFYFFLPNRQQMDLSMRNSNWLDVFYQNRTLLISALIIIAAIIFLFLAIPRTRAVILGYGVQTGRRLFGKLGKAIVLYRRSPLEVFAVLLLTIGLQILTITGFWLIGRQIGADVSVNYYYVFFTLSWISGMVPISVGGVVLVEGPLAYMFEHFALVGTTAARAVAVSQRLIWMIGSIPGVIVHLSGMHLPKNFSIDSEKDAV